MKKLLLLVCAFCSSTLIVGCKEDLQTQTSLKEAFGVEFGSNVNEVKDKILKIGSIQIIDENSFTTETITNPNPYLNSYTVRYAEGVVTEILGNSSKADKTYSLEVFDILEKELTNKYGNPTKKDIQKSDFEMLYQDLKQSDWNVGGDEINLWVRENTSKSSENTVVGIMFSSRNTYKKLAKGYENQQKEKALEKQQSASKGL